MYKGVGHILLCPLRTEGKSINGLIIQLNRSRGVQIPIGEHTRQRDPRDSSGGRDLAMLRLTSPIVYLAKHNT